MKEISLFRLYLLRALYLLVVVGLGIVVWPGIIRHEQWDLMEGVVQCMLASFSLLSLLGLRYPLQMLPLLLWEMLWKLIWLSVVALPLYTAGQIDDSTLGVVFECLVVAVFPFCIPWRYVFSHYIKKRSDRWVGGKSGITG
ncbi:hypothetical protein D3C87_1053010 [compost metagenome]